MEATTEVDRRTYIGGSDAAAICGKSPWTTPLDVYRYKVGETAELEMSEKMQWGLALEEPIAKEYSTRTERKVIPAPFWRDLERPWLGGHADRVVVSDPDGKSVRADRLVEIKTSAPWHLEEWEVAIPIHYQYQAQLYMRLYRVPLCDFAVLFGGQEMKIYTLEANKAIQDEIVEAADHFWHYHVEPKVPPPMSLKEHRDAEHHGTVEMPRDVRGVLDLLKVTNAQIADATARRDDLRARIASMMGNASDGYLDGKLVAKWYRKTRKAYQVEEKTWSELRTFNP